MTDRYDVGVSLRSKLSVAATFRSKRQSSWYRNAAEQRGTVPNQNRFTPHITPNRKVRFGREWKQLFQLQAWTGRNLMLVSLHVDRRNQVVWLVSFQNHNQHVICWLQSILSLNIYMYIYISSFVFHRAATSWNNVFFCLFFTFSVPKSQQFAFSASFCINSVSMLSSFNTPSS